MESSRKIERLDDAFLFVISLIGLLFAIIQIYMEGISGLLEISPLIFLGVFLPFYIGYLRGAIAVDSVIERVRGWVYLAVGVSTYLAFFLMRIDPNIYWLFILIAYVLTYFLEKWLNTIFKIEDNISNLYAYFGTTISGFSLAVISRRLIILFFVSIPNQTPLFSLLIEVLFIYAGLIIAIVLERLSRNVVTVQLPLKEEEIKNRRRVYSSLD